MGIVKEEAYGGYVYNLGNHSFYTDLPYSFMERKLQEILMELNDAGLTFKQIAYLLEKYL